MVLVEQTRTSFIQDGGPCESREIKTLMPINYFSSNQLRQERMKIKLQKEQNIGSTSNIMPLH